MSVTSPCEESGSEGEDGPMSKNGWRTFPSRGTSEISMSSGPRTEWHDRHCEPADQARELDLHELLASVLFQPLLR